MVSTGLTEGNEKLIKLIKQEAEKVSLLAEQAEAFSIEAIDVVKVEKRLQDLAKSLKTTGVLLGKNERIDKDLKEMTDEFDTRIADYAKGPLDFINQQTQIIEDMENRNDTGTTSLDNFQSRLAARFAIRSTPGSKPFRA